MAKHYPAALSARERRPCIWLLCLPRLLLLPSLLPCADQRSHLRRLPCDHTHAASEDPTHLESMRGGTMRLLVCAHPLPRASRDTGGLLAPHLSSADPARYSDLPCRPRPGGRCPSKVQHFKYKIRHSLCKIHHFECKYKIYHFECKIRHFECKSIYHIFKMDQYPEEAIVRGRAQHNAVV